MNKKNTMTVGMMAAAILITTLNTKLFVANYPKKVTRSPRLSSPTPSSTKTPAISTNTPPVTRSTTTTSIDRHKKKKMVVVAGYDSIEEP
ncbi:hypothetical protein L2E82_05859 [Cichorium intybus]|uniref:Uncharacterized protein n=1 Tax=Cichorium intybus TaxID=13427 RepID=A0ACB9H906_CICIN|nr:hypothetical protein L2E82_05859 [Cichorium intybus]